MAKQPKIRVCKNCNNPLPEKATVCPLCGAKNKKPIYKRVLFWLLMVFVIAPIIGGILGSGETTNSGTSNNLANTTNTSNNASVSTKQSVFDGDCGIEASAKMGSSIIGYPELTISVSNTTNKEISAIQFYAVPYDVYGDEITGWTSQNKLYTDSVIGAGASDSLTYQFIEDSVKTVKLYVYSVYFSDGSEWGDKDATQSTIIKNGAIIEVFGQS